MKKILLSAAVIALLSSSAILWAGEASLSSALRSYFSRDYPAAIEAFKEIIAREPENAAAYYYLGYTYQEMGNYLAARMAFKKTYEINPDFLPNVP